MSEMHELLARSNATLAQTSNKDGIPGIPQGVMDLQRRAALLLQAGKGDQASLRARSFLPAEPLEGMSRLGYTLEQKSAFQPGAPAPPPGPEADLSSFLESHHTLMIFAAIEEAADAANTLAHKAQLRWEAEDWDTAKTELRRRKEEQPAMRMLDAQLVLQDHPDLMEIATIDSTVAQSLVNGPSRLTPTQLKCAAAVREATTSGDPSMQYGLGTRLYNVVLELSKLSADALSDVEQFKMTLELLAAMLEDVSPDGATPVLADASLRGDEEAMRVVLAERARKHLESTYAEAMQRKVIKAQGEGRVRLETQGPLGYADGYTQLSRPGGTMDLAAVYETVYHCLRSGHVKEALDAARDKRLPMEVLDALEVLMRPERFSAADAEAAFGRVRDSHSKLDPSHDAFEKAVLNLLGFVSVQAIDKREVVRKTEDYLWWSLWFTRPVNPANTPDARATAGSPFTVQDLAAKILKWGEPHFDPDGSKAFLYARVLFIIQMFREGVSHLAKTRPLEATHAALLLDHYNVFRDLSRPGGSDALIAQPYTVTMEDLIVQYIKDFSDVDVCEAADYLLCLRPPRKLEEAIQGLLVETRKEELRQKLVAHLRNKLYSFEYAVDVRDPASPSAPPRREVRSYQWGEDTAVKVIRRAGKRAEDVDMRTAMSLYTLADDYVGALRVLNRQLCDVVVPPNRERDEWLKEAARFKRDFMGRLPQGSPEAADLQATLESLLDIRRFLDLFEKDDMEGALRVVYRDLKVFPETHQQLEAKQAAFRASPPEFRKLLEQVALRTMKCLYERYLNLNRDRMTYSQWRPNAPGGVSTVADMRRGVNLEADNVRESAARLKDYVMAATGEVSQDTISRIERLNNAMIL